MTSRRQFITGDLGGHSSPIRPPWSISEQNFFDQCTSCDDCIKACPEGILNRGRGGYPEVHFSAGACTFCQACVEQCETGALTLSDIAWHSKAQISQDCLTYEGVACQSCQDSCDYDAIRFKYISNTVAQPELEADECTACGACISICPSNAIAIKQTHNGRVSL